MLGYLLAATIPIAIFSYAIYGLYVIDLFPPFLEGVYKPVVDWCYEPGNFVRVMVWVGAIVVCVVAWSSPSGSVLADLQGEFTGIAITVVLLDELAAYRNRLEREQEILEQVQSRIRDVAVEALRLAQKHKLLRKLVKRNGLMYGQFEGAYLVYADLQEANLTSANLQGANLEGANLRSANLMRANLREANLCQSNLQKSLLWMADLQEATLINANLQGANLVVAKLQKVRMWGANLEDADLLGANLQHANLEKANLKGANLEDANLQSVEMWRVNLQHANLEKANLQGANLTEAVYDSNTIWPKGFDPKAAGAIEDEIYIHDPNVPDIRSLKFPSLTVNVK